MPEQNILLQTLDTRWQRHGSESGLRTALVYFFVLTTCGLAIWLTLSPAFPVLARIIEERGLSRSPLGIMAIACAAVDDVTAWCILAFVLAIATSGDLGGSVLTLFLLLI